MAQEINVVMLNLIVKTVERARFFGERWEMPTKIAAIRFAADDFKDGILNLLPDLKDEKIVQICRDFLGDCAAAKDADPDFNIMESDGLVNAFLKLLGTVEASVEGGVVRWDHLGTKLVTSEFVQRMKEELEALRDYEKRSKAA